jgi:hypothetical protein
MSLLCPKDLIDLLLPYVEFRFREERNKITLNKISRTNLVFVKSFGIELFFMLKIQGFI